MIDKQTKIKNVIILVDEGILENTDNTNRFYPRPVYNHSPVSSNVSYFTFYSNYLKYYFNNYFFLKHTYFKITGTYKEEWMKDAFANPELGLHTKCKNYPTLADSLLETNFREYKRVFKPDYVSYPQKRYPA